MKRTLLSGVMVILAANLAYAQAPSNAVIDKYCVTCHNDKTKTGGLTLANLDLAHPAERRAQLEKATLKLRAGMMPPPGMPRPDAATINALVSSIEETIDKEGAAHPNPGRPILHRLNQ